jgi:protein O-GlcNAc transferase
MNTELQRLHGEAARLTNAGQYAQALELFERMTGLTGCPPDAWINAAQLALALNQPLRAAKHLEYLRPRTRQKQSNGVVTDHPVIAAMLAKCWRLESKFDAVLALLKPFAGKPQSFEMRLEQALAEAGTLQLASAYAAVTALLREQPQHLEALCHGSRIAINVDELEQAGAWLKQAEALAGPAPEIRELFGDLYHAGAQLPLARDAYRQAVAGAGVTSRSVSRLYLLERRFANWAALPPLEARLNQMIDAALHNGARLQTEPFVLLSLLDDHKRLYEATTAYVRPLLERIGRQKQAGASLPALVAPAAAEAGRRLRIGYASTHFSNHAGMHLVASMFAHHDRAAFEVTAISYGSVPENPFRASVRAQVDRFVDIDAPDGLAEARLLRELELDILIDFRGFTERGRLHLYPFRPAHLHASWLGYPGPMPAGLVDYQIVDPIVAPPTDRDGFGAALAYLPHTYQMTDNTQAAGAPVSRAEVIPEAGERFVFACFCQVYKVQPELFAIWMQVLSAVPDSVLWLWADEDEARQNLRAAAQAAGVAPERLIFASQAAKAQHLARVRHADLVFDTWRYGGHVTTTDMLWAGVPVIAKEGSHFASRVSQSLLKAAGLGELVAADAAGYRDLAIALARDPERLAAIRKRTEAARENSALFDTEGRVRELEALYRSMWQRLCEGLPHADIHLE